MIRAFTFSALCGVKSLLSTPTYFETRGSLPAFRRTVSCLRLDAVETTRRISWVTY